MPRCEGSIIAERGRESSVWCPGKCGHHTIDLGGLGLHQWSRALPFAYRMKTIYPRNLKQTSVRRSMELRESNHQGDRQTWFPPITRVHTRNFIAQLVVGLAALGF